MGYGQKRTRPISRHLNQTSLVNKGFIVYTQHSNIYSVYTINAGHTGNALNQPNNHRLKPLFVITKCLS